MTEAVAAKSGFTVKATNNRKLFDVLLNGTQFGNITISEQGGEFVAIFNGNVGADSMKEIIPILQKLEAHFAYAKEIGLQAGA